MTVTAPASLDSLLESIDVTVTETTRVRVRTGRRFATHADTITLVYVAAGALAGAPATHCEPDPDRAGAVVLSGLQHAGHFPSGAALLSVGRSPLAFAAAEDATLVVVTLDLNHSAHRLRDLVPDPLTITDFSRIDPAVSSLASNMGDHGGAEAAVSLAGGGAILCRLMARTLLLGVLRAWVSAGCAPQGWAARAADPQLDPVLAAIHSDPGGNWTLDTLAALGTMSRSALARRFRELLGVSPGQYLSGVRVEEAKQRLRRGTPVTQVAHELGYASDEGFSRAFRRHTGASPSRWRIDGGAGAQPAVARLPAA